MKSTQAYRQAHNDARSCAAAMSEATDVSKIGSIYIHFFRIFPPYALLSGLRELLKKETRGDGENEKREGEE